MPVETSLAETRLRGIIRRFERVLVAYSGGVDSALVLTVAHQELGKNAIGVTAHSPSVPERERRAAAAFAQSLGVRHIVVETGEVDLPDYRENPANRCFFCKTELYTHLQSIAAVEGIATVLNGTNRDDLGDHRPGLQAAEHFRVSSPLVEAGMRKQDVRDVARTLGLPLWEKPASPCLASRIPYGQEVTREKLGMVERAEDFLLSLGYRELRVRHFGNRAVIELPRHAIGAFVNGPHRKQAEDRLLQLGFDQVEIDPEGFRSGNLNSALS
ncbi:MAG: ATP-dependent sacrificial sulfur transferase LarE [Nitrospina sp.]|nr:ATP-dependent sacrificial sulfur transferase LarE [Nitrospina sp.]